MINMKVVLLQRQLGTASFMVLFGTMYSRQVTVRYMDRSFFESLWAQGKYPEYTRAEFERNVLDEIGIVHAAFKEVPPDVVRAVWEDLAIERSLTPDRFAKYFTSGTYAADKGWAVSNICAFPGQTVIENAPGQDLEPQQVPSVRVESLSQRPVH